MEYVVDQNYLRKDDLRELANNPDNSFLITDSALLEMSKSEQWESTIRASLQILSEIPDRVTFTISVSEAIELEKNNKRAISKSDLVRPDYNDFFKGLLGEVKSGEFGPSFTLHQTKIFKGIAGLNTGILNHDLCKKTVGNLINTIKNDIDPEFRRSLSRKEISDEELNTEVRNLVPYAFRSYFSDMGFDEDQANNFVSKKPINARYLYVNLMVAFDWISKNGFEGYKPEKVTNELIDNSYIILASYYDGVLSYEKSVQKLYKNLNSVLEL